MVYPGNESISPEIRKRIVETFRQTLGLAEKGSRQEALLGCDFILRLDPMFESARSLAARVESGEAIDVSDLRREFEAAMGAEELPAAAPLPQVDLVDDPAAEDDQGGVDDLFDPPAPAATPPSADSPGGVVVPPAPDATPLSADSAGGVVDPPAPASTPPPAEPPGAVLEPPAIDEPAASAAPPPLAPDPPSPSPPAESPPPVAAESPAAAEPDEDAADLSDPSIEFVGEPAVALDNETQSRIDDLLAEGQLEFDRSEYQAAIDAWSRIFLIDIDHPEANRRIELARKLKAEVERGVEEAMHEGVAALERRDTDGARAAFEKILQLQPSHASARDYLQRLDSDEPPFPGAEAEASKDAGDAAPAAAEPAADGEIEAEVFTPPSPGTTSPPRVPTPTVARTMAAGASGGLSRGRRFVYLGAAVFVVVLAASWFLWSRSSSFFPNAEEPQTAATAPDPIRRATTLFEQGKQSIAIAQLRRLGPDHPSYAEAQALIFQWESGLAEPDSGVDPEAVRMERREELIAEARDLAAAQRLIAAEALLVQASAIAPLEGENARLATEIGEQLDPIRTQIEIYQQGEWAIALRDLWRMHENGMRDPALKRLMVDCYYNLGVRDLQRGDTSSAEGRFAEAIALSDGDEALARLRRFSRLYVERQPDLLYRIFVKYLPFR